MYIYVSLSLYLYIYIYLYISLYLLLSRSVLNSKYFCSLPTFLFMAPSGARAHKYATVFFSLSKYKIFVNRAWAQMGDLLPNKSNNK